ASAATDAAELVLRLRDPGRRTELLEVAERLADRVARCPFLSCPPRNDAQAQERACTPEGISGRLVFCSRPLQERGRLLDVPSCGCDETAAAFHMREHPVAAEPQRVSLPGIEGTKRVVD